MPRISKNTKLIIAVSIISILIIGSAVFLIFKKAHDAANNPEISATDTADKTYIDSVRGKGSVSTKPSSPTDTTTDVKKKPEESKNSTPSPSQNPTNTTAPGSSATPTNDSYVSQTPSELLEDNTVGQPTISVECRNIISVLMQRDIDISQQKYNNIVNTQTNVQGPANPNNYPPTSKEYSELMAAWLSDPNNNMDTSAIEQAYANLTAEQEAITVKYTTNPTQYCQ